MSGAPYYRERREIIANREASLVALRTFCLDRGWELSVSSFDEDMGFTITIEGKTKAPRMSVLPYLGGGDFRFCFWEYETEKRGKSLVITMALRNPERLMPLEDDVRETFRRNMLDHPFFTVLCREEKPFWAYTTEELVWKALTMPPSREFPLDSRLRTIALENYKHLTGKEVNYNNLWSTL